MQLAVSGTTAAWFVMLIWSLGNSAPRTHAIHGGDIGPKRRAANGDKQPLKYAQHSLRTAARGKGKAAASINFAGVCLVPRCRCSARQQERDAGPPWQEVVPLRCPGQAVVQAIAEDAHRAGLGAARTKQMVTCKNPTGRVCLPVGQVHRQRWVTGAATGGTEGG